MANKEFKIGEEFQWGIVKLRVEEYYNTTSSCNKCFFYECCDAEGLSIIDQITGGCLASQRNDRKDVIFVKVEE